MQKSRFIIIIFLLLLVGGVPANPFKTLPIKQNIQTLRVYRSGWPLSYPVIQLNSDDQIQIAFDDIEADGKEYKYRVIHCNSDWEPSMLSFNEYSGGFYDNFIEDYDYSFNTNMEYVHYQINLPNNNVPLKVSGNYAVQIFESSNMNDPVAVACFYVIEHQVQVNADVEFVTQNQVMRSQQQIQMNILHPSYVISDPHNHLTVNVRQNNNPHFSATVAAPTYVRNGVLMYENNLSLAFNAGDEYRHFDATTFRFNGEGVLQQEFIRPLQHVELYHDKKKASKDYRFKYDQNGRSVIRKVEADQDQLDYETDYMYVHFTLPAESPEFTGRVYIDGDFTYGELSEKFELNYSFETHRYTASLLLKQGYYNYRYLFLPKGGTKPSNIPFENNYYQTENDYLIFVYHQSTADRYQRIIGFKQVNAGRR